MSDTGDQECEMRSMPADRVFISSSYHARGKHSVRHVRATCRGRDGDKHKTNEATTMRPMYQCTESLQTTWSLEDGYTVNACSPLAWTCHIGCKVPFIHRTHRNLRTQLRSSIISDRQQTSRGGGGLQWPIRARTGHDPMAGKQSESRAQLLVHG